MRRCRSSSSRVVTNQRRDGHMDDSHNKNASGFINNFRLLVKCAKCSLLGALLRGHASPQTQNGSSLVCPPNHAAGTSKSNIFIKWRSSISVLKRNSVNKSRYNYSLNWEEGKSLWRLLMILPMDSDTWEVDHGYLHLVANSQLTHTFHIVGILMWVLYFLARNLTCKWRKHEPDLQIRK